MKIERRKKSGIQRPGDENYTAQENRANNCRGRTTRTKKIDEKDHFLTLKKSKTDWNRFLRREERDIFTEDNEEVDMLSTHTTQTDMPSGREEYVFFDRFYRINCLLFVINHF